MTINNWYTSPANHIETIKASDNKTLSDSKIDGLVSAMAAFTVPAMGQTTLSSTYVNSLAPVLKRDLNDFEPLHLTAWVQKMHY